MCLASSSFRSTNGDYWPTPSAEYIIQALPLYFHDHFPPEMTATKAEDRVKPRGEAKRKSRKKGSSGRAKRRRLGNGEHE